jgi:hypothetical protein
LLGKEHAGRAFFTAQWVSEQAALQKGMEVKSVEFVKQGDGGLSQGVSLSHSVKHTGRIAARFVYWLLCPDWLQLIQAVLDFRQLSFES